MWDNTNAQTRRTILERGAGEFLRGGSWLGGGSEGAVVGEARAVAVGLAVTAVAGIYLRGGLLRVVLGAGVVTAPCRGRSRSGCLPRLVLLAAVDAVVAARAGWCSLPRSEPWWLLTPIDSVVPPPPSSLSWLPLLSLLLSLLVDIPTGGVATRGQNTIAPLVVRTGGRRVVTT